jgi:hypothetical protein
MNFNKPLGADVDNEDFHIDSTFVTHKKPNEKGIFVTADTKTYAACYAHILEAFKNYDVDEVTVVRGTDSNGEKYINITPKDKENS